MLKIYQTKFYKPELKEKGDCLRACLASLLELDILTFDHHTWIGDYTDKMFELGYAYFGTAKTIDLIDSNGVNGLFIAYGLSNRKCFHAILIDKFGNKVHDPHPSNEGINNIENIFIIEKF